MSNTNTVRNNQVNNDPQTSPQRLSSFYPSDGEEIAITLITINVRPEGNNEGYFDPTVFSLSDAKSKIVVDEYDEVSTLRINASGRVVADGGQETRAGVMKWSEVVDVIHLQNGAVRMYQPGRMGESDFVPEQNTKVICSTEPNPEGTGLKRRTLLKGIEPYIDEFVLVNLWINPTDIGSKVCNLVVRPITMRSQLRASIEAEVVNNRLLLRSYSTKRE